ncbi:uncharacterized protein [Engystomops pustulosus]|uniref:uncharacterized protein n=1 Tax=Engystomops pustulosus TaxID=76066 RepID=UPI003AFA690F
MRQAISPEQRLLVTLRFLATGESYHSMQHQFRIGKSTLCKIIPHTCAVIWAALQPRCMPFPTTNYFQAISKGFEEKTDFPNCLGAIDGKHIRVIQPPHSGTLFFNYKKYFSIVLLAIADSDSNFIAIETGSYGSTNDSRILETSAMARQLLQKHINIPPAKALTGSSTILPHVFVADEAFGLRTHLLRPYCKRGLTNMKRIYNARLSRARKTVECAFGILSGQWRLLKAAICLSVENVDTVVKACCVLHNFSRIGMSPHALLDVRNDVNLANTIDQCNCRALSGWRTRDEFLKYFNSEHGAVAWQYDAI